MNFRNTGKSTAYERDAEVQNLCSSLGFTSHLITSFITNMRKIEREMIQAIIDGRNWKKANTEVEAHPSGNNEMRVFLHGNNIASYYDGNLYVNHCGWQTVTTKSRLNSLINFVVDPTKNGIYQKNYKWFITRDGVDYQMLQGWHQV